MQKPIIAIDVDDVLAHSIEAFRLQVNAKTGAALMRKDFLMPGAYHRYLDRVLKTNGIDYAAIKHELFEHMVKDQSHVQPLPGAADVLKMLRKRYDLVVITARYPGWAPQTHIWMERNFPGIFIDVHFAGWRDDPARKTKGDMCLEAGASYLIDDNPEHAIDARDKGVKAVLYGDYGWHINVPDDMVRCKTWQDVQRFFDVEGN